MSLLIKNGEIVTPGWRAVADVYCEDETITAIGRGLDAPAGDGVPGGDKAHWIVVRQHHPVRIQRRDRKRLIRALEVYFLTGQPLE